MPMAVHIDNPQQYRSTNSRHATCERWGLAPEATRVLFVFDVKSSLERKTPGEPFRPSRKAAWRRCNSKQPRIRVCR